MDAHVLPRSPAELMRPERAAASVANALSFPRAIMREMVRDRYRIEKLRFELDAHGRGEVLYRITGAGWTFHFFLIADLLPEDAKTDRNFAQGWDAMGVLCQGEWTAERESLLRREIPKQRAGYADYDTLMYARGNRSARVFDHVVESLAAGKQPDPQVLAPVGYILRTTAFIGNGQLGTRPLAGYEPDHPLRKPYHAQFCSAFALREYVFDLADHLARSRNPDAARLSPAMRRFIGLGNSAATGLVAFLYNHPHFLHRWTAAVERGYAAAAARGVDIDGPTAHAGLALLDKAVRYYREGAKEPDGVFMPPQALASELQQVREHLSDLLAQKRRPLSWLALCQWARERVCVEAQEVLYAILLELYPDIWASEADAFEACEKFEIQPAMPVSELRALIEEHYSWALDQPMDPSSTHHFWYRCSAAPRDIRRGLRGRAPQYEAENNMDTVPQLQRLHAYLTSRPVDEPIAVGLCERPELRHIAARVQSLQGMDYAEMRQSCLTADFSPFASIRYVLTFYGMEKFEAARPKSVRGTFMQGAPIAEDVARGRDADWPFPLIPREEDANAALAYLDPLPESTLPDPDRMPAPPISRTDVLRIAPAELARMMQHALQGHGLALGVAEEAGRYVAFAQCCGEPSVQWLLDAFAHGTISHETVAGVRPVHEHSDARSGWCFDTRGAPVLVVATQAHDLAVAEALRSEAGEGRVILRSGRHGAVLKEVVLRAATHGVVAMLLWTEDDGRGGYAMSGPDEGGAWFATGALSAASILYRDAMSGRPLMSDMPPCATNGARAVRLAERATAPAADTEVSASGCVLVCLHPRGPVSSSDLAEAMATATSSVYWRGAVLAQRQQAWLREGIAITRAQYDALGVAGERLLVPRSDESALLPEGADPLKTF